MMTGFQIAITIILGLFGTLITIGLGLLVFRNSKDANATNTANSIAKIASDLSTLSTGITNNMITLSTSISDMSKSVTDMGISLGEVKNGVNALEKTVGSLDNNLEIVQAESANAHAEIKTNIEKSSKKSQKRTERLIRESEERLVAHINKNTPNSNQYHNSMNQ